MGRLKTLLITTLLAISLVACSGDSGEGTTVSTDTSAPNETAAPSPTTAKATTTTTTTAASATAEPEVINGFVTFDGSDCTFSGPSEVPPGDYAFVLTNLSDVGAVLFARELIDGHTYQDALDQMDEAGGPGSYWPRPSWAADVTRDPDPPKVELANGQRLLALSLEPGTYNLGVYTATSPEGIWLCAPLDVQES